MYILAVVPQLTAPRLTTLAGHIPVLILCIERKKSLEFIPKILEIEHEQEG